MVHECWKSLIFLNKYVWSNALVFLFLAVGLIFTLRTRFVQVRRFKDMITLLFEKDNDSVGIRLGLNPTFNPLVLGIKNADFWEDLEARSSIPNTVPSKGKTVVAKKVQERLQPVPNPFSE